MVRITVKRHTAYGLNSSGYNVFSHGNLIGYCAANDVDTVLSGNLHLIYPIANWRSRFSVSLKKEIGLPITPCGYDDKGADITGTNDGQCLSMFI